MANGFRIAERRKETDIITAGEWMRGKGRRRWTSGRREGGRAVLTRHVVVCPVCGWEVPAYAEFLGSEPDGARVPRREVEQWADPQLSLYEQEDREILFNRVARPRGSFSCPRCREESGPCSRKERLHICGREGELSLTLEDVGVGELLAMPGESGDCLCLPLRQTVNFLLKEGSVHLILTDGEGKELGRRDITFDRESWRDSEIYRLLSRSRIARRKALSAFEELYGAPLPMDKEEAEPEDLVAMTAFRGFPRAFYDAVPYDVEGGSLDESFRRAAEQLRAAEGLDRLYGTSSLPGGKSVKKLFFAHPGLFFYLEEAELLWELTEDVNVFRRILSGPEIYEMLSFFHRYSGGLDFLRDYRREKGAPALAEQLEKRWMRVERYALRYGAMSEYSRERERKRWKKGIPDLAPGCSVPMGPEWVDPENCTVDGYRFVLLRSGRDYYRAGTELNNCLVEWRSMDNPVVVMKKGDRTVAAIEMEDNRVVQARKKDNLPLEEDPELERAFRRWMDRWGLTVETPCADEDEVEYFF